MDQKVNYKPDAEKSILKSEFLESLTDENLANLLQESVDKLNKAKISQDPFLIEGFRADCEKIIAEIDRRKNSKK